MIENEIKFRIKDVALLRRRLRLLGVTMDRPRRQVDYSFDTAARDVARRKMLIRLRRDGSSALLTFKGPPLPGKFKQRFEYNVKVTSFSAAKRVLHQMGLQPHFLKEKIRQQGVFGAATVCLDSIPFLGSFIEIEGSDAAIEATIRALKLNRRAAIKATYSELFQTFLRQQHAGGNSRLLMRFSGTKGRRSHVAERKHAIKY